MRKELVQHDEKLEKEREDAKRRDANLMVICYRTLFRHPSRKRKQTLVTSRIHRTNQKKWMEKNDASDRKHNTEKRAIPWRGPGAQYKRERNEKEKPTKKQRHSQGERQSARARSGTSANERKPGRGKAAKPMTRARTRAKGKE